ncbi:MAG: hypothetical protein Q7S82_00520 [bacterium]|nr:hypothetical protein [bacterium]
MNWIPIVLLVVAGFLLIRYGKGLLAAAGNLFKDNAAAFAAVIIALVVAVLIIAMFQPQILVGSSGIFGSNLKGARAEANLKTAILDPRDDPSVWKSAPAQAAAEASASEYQLATARNKAGISAAEAERLCRLPKGHAERALWDQAGLDPCEASLPAGLQGATRAVAKTTGEVAQSVGNTTSKIDLAATDKELSKPLGQAPADADNWLRQLYNLPKGLLVIAGLMLAIIVLGKMATSLLRTLLRVP